MVFHLLEGKRKIAVILRRHIPRSDRFHKHVQGRAENSPVKEAFLVNTREKLR